ncbi:hypothetical protein QYE76_018095 [Lolium multiflorum]|uniref:Uncharacterized protein n=1 Tax=Lolium multiflorum TaxID=4521 RepID=A0AAD8QEZ7_LOLMU|nr:hypothetical protein QYE76_018095 [Lolium multiflorum]
MAASDGHGSCAPRIHGSVHPPDPMASLDGRECVGRYANTRRVPGGDGTYVFQLRSTSPYVLMCTRAQGTCGRRSIVTMHVPRRPGYAALCNCKIKKIHRGPGRGMVRLAATEIKRENAIESSSSSTTTRLVGANLHTAGDRTTWSVEVGANYGETEGPPNWQVRLEVVEVPRAALIVAATQGWRGRLSAMVYGDNGTMKNLRQEADELPYCRCDDHPETASSNSSLSPPRRGRRRSLLLHLWPPNPPEMYLLTEIFVSLHCHISGSDHRSSTRQRRRTSQCQIRSMRPATSLPASAPYAI